MSRLVILVALALAFALPDTTEATSLIEVKKLTASDAQGDHRFGRKVSVSGDTVVVGANQVSASGDPTGAAYVFQRDEGGIENWGEVTKLASSDMQEGDSFGVGVAVSGDTAVVGAMSGPVEVVPVKIGAAYVFERNEGGVDNWGEVTKLTASDAQVGDSFGLRVAVSGDTAVVGAPFEDAGGDFAGAAYIFQRDEGGANNWGEVTKLASSDMQEGDNFGYDLAISGDTVVVGANLEDAGGDEAGAAYVFQRDEGGADNWGEMKKLTASDAQAGAAFGVSVAVSGDTAVVGAYNDDAGGFRAGATYVFQRDEGGAGNWGEVKKLTASDAQPNGLFGILVAVSGDTAVVGSFADAAYVFQRDGGGANNWGEAKKLTASGSLFGFSVAVSGDSAVVGSFGGTPPYVFQRDAGGAGNWGEVKKLTASDGFSVAVSGDTAVGDAFGAAHVFQRDQGGADNWGEVKKLTASDGQASDSFAISVAVSGDTAVVGAFGEDAGGDNAGAAYVFDLLLSKPTATVTATATITPTPPPPVGGISQDSELRALPLETTDPVRSPWGVVVGIVAAVCLLAAAGAAWYARRRHA